MAEYLAQEESLTAIADAIRNKTSINESLPFPSDFISAINSIGQGSGSGIKFATETMTFDSDYYVSSGSGTEIKHNLGVVPDAIFIRSSKTISTVTHLSYYFGTRRGGIFDPEGKLNTSFQATGIATNYNNMSVAAEGISNDFTSSNGNCVKNADATSFYFCPPSNMMAKAGEEYIWYAIGKAN